MYFLGWVTSQTDGVFCQTQAGLRRSRKEGPKEMEIKWINLDCGWRAGKKRGWKFQTMKRSEYETDGKERAKWSQWKQWKDQRERDGSQTQWAYWTQVSVEPTSLLRAAVREVIETEVALEFTLVTLLERYRIRIFAINETKKLTLILLSQNSAKLIVENTASFYSYLFFYNLGNYFQEELS